VGLTENFGPVTEHTDIVFDRVITNIGGAYEQKTGRFTAPYDAVYQFNVIVSAQGRQKVICILMAVVVGLQLVAWLSGRTSVSGRRTFPVLRSTCS